MIVNFVFYGFAAVALGGAVAVAVSRNIVRASFALLAVLLATAGLYGVMKSDLLVVIQILIYVGGILVLIVFAIMLTHRITDVRVSNESAPSPVAFFACLGLFLLLVTMGVGSARWRRDANPIRVALSEDAQFSFAQYQADGTTGLPRGSVTFEPEIVLVVRFSRVPSTASEIEARWVPVREPEKAVARRGPIPECTLRFPKLPEGPGRWDFRLVGAEGFSERGDLPDGIVRRGLIETVGEGLMGRYLLAFELMSVLLLAALLGAAFLARKEVRG